MDIGFIFNGALTAAQHKAIKEGVRVALSDDLSSLDKVVYGSGVVVPEGDYELVSFADYAPQSKKKSKKKAAVASKKNTDD